MKPEIARRLIALNRQFYEDFGEEFSATRRRIQPGVQGILHTLKGDEAVLDLGCGNGELARALAGHGHRGPYLGLDFSLPLLSEAVSTPGEFPAVFAEADLSADWEKVARSAFKKQFPLDLVFSFATLHHLPLQEWRLHFIQKAHALLRPDGRFIHSNWQFLNSPRLKDRVQPWSEIDLGDTDVDPGDYLLDWRSGGRGLRYVHHFDEAELSKLAALSGFHIQESFYSDGKEGNLSIYQVWKT